MKLSRIGRASLAIVASLSMGLGMTACGGGTIGFMWIMAGKLSSNGTGNVINGYKIDDYTGNLTEMVYSPYSASGTNPTMAVLKPGGRFMYVVNQGDPDTGAGSGVAEFIVGGDGVLTYQQTFFSVGTFPQWIQMDATGNYLYVLDKVAPPVLDPVTGNPVPGATPTGCQEANCGSITVFAVAGDTGRLTLVTNNSIKVNDRNLTYFPTGPEPFMMRLVSSGYLMIVNGGNQTITSYSTSGAGGQITTAGNVLEQNTSATGITSITSSGGTNGYVYLTDGGTTSAPQNRIFPYTVSNGTLTAVAGGTVENFVPNVTPVWTLTETHGKIVYVLNRGNTGATVSSSSISAFTIDGNGKLTQAPGSQPYAVGANPMCMVEDPASKYVYTSNADGTVTGFEINQATSELRDLRRGSTFNVIGKPACLVVSGNVD